MGKKINIVLCADRNVLPGLHVTLFSALFSLNIEVEPTFRLFYEGISNRDIQLLEQTLDLVGKPYELRAEPISLGVFKGSKSLRGNYMPYARIALPALLPDIKEALYLDSDLLVTVDLDDLFDEGLDGCLAGFPYDGGQMKLAIEKELFRGLGYDLERPYFNTGVILMNLEKWRGEKIMDKALQVIDEHGGQLQAADQTIINMLIYGRLVKTFEEKYNVQMFPGRHRPEWEKGVFHFIGSPKPWDLFGEIISCHGENFVRWLDRTAYQGWRSYKNVRPRSIKVAARNGNAYARCVRARIRGIK